MLLVLLANGHGGAVLDITDAADVRCQRALLEGLAHAAFDERPECFAPGVAAPLAEAGAALDFQQWLSHGQQSTPEPQSIVRRRELDQTLLHPGAQTGCRLALLHGDREDELVDEALGGDGCRQPQRRRRHETFLAA